MSIPRAILILVALVGAFLAYRFATVPVAEQKPIAQVVQQFESRAQAKTAEAEEPVIPVVDRRSCLTDEQILEHPLIVHDIYRFHSALNTGPDVENFRGMELHSVEEFAAQGDSAAMAVLGAAAVLRALGKQQSNAVEWLQMEEQRTSFVPFGSRFSSDGLLALNDAAYWFYQSALSGRLYALVNYGDVRNAAFGGAVGLGWVTQAEFDSFNAREKSALHPVNVYTALVYDLVPELSEGIGASLNPVAETELQLEIRSMLQTEFNQAHDESGLPPISVPPAAAEFDFQELLSQACSNDRDN